VKPAPPVVLVPLREGLTARQVRRPTCTWTAICRA